MKAIWKGYLKCSLVTIPVSMYTAVSKKAIQFHQLHKECKNRIKHENVCPIHGKIPNEEIIKAYEIAKDTYVVVTDEDLEKARKESTEVIEIIKFVDDPQIRPIYYSDSHYLAPDGKVGAESFALFHKAITQAKKTALAKVVMRNREHLFAIKPYNGGLIAQTLYYKEEIQGIERIEELEGIKKVAVDGNSLNLAKTLIQNMSGDFKADEYKDEYTQTLLEIIKAKAEGEEIKVEPRAERAQVINFMDALKKSVKETEKKPKEVPKKGIATAGKREVAPVKKRKIAHAG